MPCHKTVDYSFPRHKQNPALYLLCYGNYSVLYRAIIKRVSAIRATKPYSEEVSVINSILINIYTFA